MKSCKLTSTPLETGKTEFHKRTDDEETINSQVYQQAIGCLTIMHPQLQGRTLPWL